MRFTVASDTPSTCCKARCTCAWQATHDMSVTGRLTCSEATWCWVVSTGSLLFDDEPAAEHPHAAGELVGPGLRGVDFHCGLFERRQEPADAEVVQDDLLGAARRFL